MSNDNKTPVFVIQGLKIRSRLGEENLLAFPKEKGEIRFLLRSTEVISISYLEPSKEDLPSILPAMPPACVTVKTVSMPTATVSMERK